VKILEVNIRFYFSTQKSASSHVGDFTFQLREQFKVFLEKRHFDLLEELESQRFNQIPAYLSDILTRMNDLSQSLPGKKTNILNCYEKLNAFKYKLSLWSRRVKRGSHSNFPTLEEKAYDNESLSLIPSVCEETVAHLEVLSMSFDIQRFLARIPLCY